MTYAEMMQATYDLGPFALAVTLPFAFVLWAVLTGKL